MARLTLILDDATAQRLTLRARVHRQRVTTLARELIREALDLREKAESRRRLAADYAADREDAAALLQEIEAAQFLPEDD